MAHLTLPPPTTHRTAGRATLDFPSPRPSPQERGRIVHRRSIRSVTEFAQQPSAKKTTTARCSLSLPPSRRSGALARREGGRERVRVRGKHAVEHASKWTGISSFSL